MKQSTGRRLSQQPSNQEIVGKEAGGKQLNLWVSETFFWRCNTAATAVGLNRVQFCKAAILHMVNQSLQDQPGQDLDLIALRKALVLARQSLPPGAEALRHVEVALKLCTPSLVHCKEREPAVAS